MQEVTAPVSGIKITLQDGKLIFGYYSAGGKFVPISCDANGNLGVSAGGAGAATEAKQPAIGTALVPSADVITVQRPAVTQVMSAALEAAKVLKGSAGQLVQLAVFNSGPDQWILLSDAASISGDGAIVHLYPPIPIAANSVVVLDLPAPVKATTGITVSNSTTNFNKTTGAADCFFYAQVN